MDIKDCAGAMPKTGSEARLLGVKYYFTGKACKHGHIAKRYAKNYSCCACQYENNRLDRLELARVEALERIRAHDR